MTFVSWSISHTEVCAVRHAGIPNNCSFKLHSELWKTTQHGKTHFDVTHTEGASTLGACMCYYLPVGTLKCFIGCASNTFLFTFFEETHMQSTVFPTFNYGLEFHRGKQSKDKHNQREVKSNSHRESCSDASNTNTVAMDGRNNLYISKTFYYFYFPNFLKGFP